MEKEVGVRMLVIRLSFATRLNPLTIFGATLLFVWLLAPNESLNCSCFIFWINAYVSKATADESFGMPLRIKIVDTPK